MLDDTGLVSGSKAERPLSEAAITIPGLGLPDTYDCNHPGDAHGLMFDYLEEHWQPRLAAPSGACVPDAER